MVWALPSPVIVPAMVHVPAAPGGFPNVLLLAAVRVAPAEILMGLPLSINPLALMLTVPARTFVPVNVPLPTLLPTDNVRVPVADAIFATTTPLPVSELMLNVVPTGLPWGPVPI